MSDAQTSTKLTKAQQDYITYCALGTYWADGDDEPTVIESVSEFCRVTGTPRRTVYAWEDNIVGFWDMVEAQRKVLLNRKLTEYYKWAEISARPITKRTKDSNGKTRQELVRAGSAEHLKILLGQSGRKASEKTDVTSGGEALEFMLYKPERIAD